MFKTVLSPKKKNPVPMGAHSPLPFPSSQPQATTDLISFFVDLPVSDISHKQDHIIYGCSLYSLILCVCVCVCVFEFHCQSHVPFNFGTIFSVSQKYFTFNIFYFKAVADVVGLCLKELYM